MNEPRSRPVVLVVDDEDVVLQVLSELLGDGGFDVRTTSTAEEALALVGDLDFHVALVDKNLGAGETGLDIVAAITKSRPEMQALLMTGYPSLESAVEAVRCGAVDYVAKPFDLPALIDKVRDAARIAGEEYEVSELVQQHELLFETVPGFVWFMTTDGRFKRINKNGASILGYDPGELVGESFEPLLATTSASDPGVHWAFRERRTGERATQQKLVAMETKDGDQRIFEVYSSGAYMAGRSEVDDRAGFVGTIGVALDVTDRERLSIEVHRSEKMRSLGRFAGGVAHDFNNLLTVINAGLDSLQMRLGDVAGNYPELQDIEEAASRAADLSHALLSFSRDTPFERIEIDVGEMIDSMAPFLESVIGKHIEFRVRCEPKLPRVEGHKSLLERVLINLCANARDAMPEGGRVDIAANSIAIDVDFEPDHGKLEPGSYVAIRVSDTGTGIGDKVQKTMFEPFITTKPQGVGLGLATVYAVVEQLGGGIQIRTAEGQGTTFTLLLPAVKGVVPATPSNPKILLVDDDGLVRKSARRIIVLSGYEVLEASSATEALAIFDTESAIIGVVTDVVMPGQNGPQLVEALRRRVPDLPVVYVSGFVGENALGVEEDVSTRYVAKPFRRNTLIAALEAVLASRDR